MVFVISRDCRQNGYDYGPIACAIIKMCMENGLEETWTMFQELPINPPSISCGHILHLIMLEGIQQQYTTSVRDYMHFVVHQPLHWDYVKLNNETIRKMQSGSDVEWDNRLLHSLTIASNSSQNCWAFIAKEAVKELRDSRACTEENHEGLNDTHGQDTNGEEDQQRGNWESEQDGHDKAKALLALLKSYRILNGVSLCRAHHPLYVVSYPSRTAIMNRGKLLKEEDCHNQDQLSNAARALCKWVKNWKLDTLQHFSKVSQPVFLKAYIKGNGSFHMITNTMTIIMAPSWKCFDSQKYILF